MDQMVLGRVGHYHVPNSQGGGSCQTAVVVEVLTPGAPVKDWQGNEAPLPYVNVAGWQHDGDPFAHQTVPVYPTRGDATSVGVSSFHLTRDCPWSR